MIPIVLAADHNYSFYLKVLVGSLITSAKPETNYRIIIITDEIFNAELLDPLSKRFNNFSLQIIRFSNENFSGAKIYNKGLSMYTYCRLFIPEILYNYDKCIYIDTDTLVTDDLSIMYEKNIDEFYLAGVKDYGLQTGGYENTALCRLKIPSMQKYVNAGVLLLNLKKIRNEKINSFFMQCIGKEWMFEDQDIINKCCYEKIDFLPVRYNVLYRYYKRSCFWNAGFYPEEDMIIAQEKPAIIHFTGRDMKPWKFIRSRAAVKWWDVAEDVLTKEEFENIYKCAESFDMEMQWDCIIKKCYLREVIVFGACEMGRSICRWLSNSGVNIKCYCDNDVNKIGKRLDSIKIKSLDMILTEENIKNLFFVISSQLHHDEIVMQLKKNGINNISCYYYKNEFYYMSLDGKYYEEELKEIEKKEAVKREDFTKDIYKRYWMEKWVYR